MFAGQLGRAQEGSFPAADSERGRGGPRKHCPQKEKGEGPRGREVKLVDMHKNGVGRGQGHSTCGQSKNPAEGS